MGNWKRALLIVLVSILVVGAAATALAYAANSFLVNLWWFDGLGYERFFWHRLLHRYGLFFGGFLLFFVVFFVNFRLGAKYMGAKHPVLREAGIAASTTNPQLRNRPYRKKYRRFQRRSVVFYLPLALVLAVVAALPMIDNGEKVLLALFAEDTGITDPLYGRDISYYLFLLPVQILFFQEMLIALSGLLLGMLLLYWLEARSVPRHDGRLRRGARIHLIVVTLLLAGAAVGYFLLEANLLLYHDGHMPLFYGPGYVETHLLLPLIWAVIALLLATGVAFIYFVNTRKGLGIFSVLAVFLLATLGARYLPFTSEMLQEYLVEPNEETLEAPYIGNNIEATLAAYDLLDVETREYSIKEPPWDLATAEPRLDVENVPIWDADGLLRVYRELQGLRSYYSFDSVDVGRYELGDLYRQVFLSVRQINLDDLPGGSQSWVNRWLKYTHGYGVVMSAAAQKEVGPMDFLLQGIPPSSEVGLTIEEPAIYYGLGHYYPAIAPNASGEFDFATRDRVHLTNYKGDSGIRLSSAFRKLVLALHFGDTNIFFTDQTNDESRLLFRRNIVERVDRLTPFFILDPDPYAVITPERVYWIQDAYTHSTWYPYSRPYDGLAADFGEDFNYIRNSVKIVVDAYDGSVDYYVVDEDDPIIGTFERIHPELFRPFDEMPPALKQHVRYPKHLFDVQMDIYGRYHQRVPGRFYKKQDFWEPAIGPWRDDRKEIGSSYMVLNLIERDQYEYSLFVPMTPAGQRNMRALAVVGCDGDNYGRIITYDFSAGTVVYGPEQIDALIKQDPDVTRQFTLWNQEGSRIDRGRMAIIPVDGRLTYVQGVFLKATTPAQTPELTRIIVSRGQMVAMAPSVEEALEKVNELIAQRSGRPAKALAAPSESPKVVSAGAEDEDEDESERADDNE